ncbi:acetylcholine-gated chloride channel subunit acc-1-like [Penaeus monodon]|uniref:acetylcholine-gated chloride channel subunit acc-1-like n=1 Tax=Penaeus monodon TaxID=6687 RepID=UPI0018A76620|nr:acetylcholine-gated chloride channel subunit acc-1-like [Penaeus monodon]
MKMVQQYTVGFMCQFRLQMYPFDTQQCILTYNISNMRDNYEFVKGGVDFTGERRLLEYMLVKEQMISQVKKGPGAVQVFFKFKNQYGYYIGNAVVPSLFMVVICYVTLFFDLHDFQDRIMVSLTSLLVLAALFSQTSQSIPKTAYLKHIDVWYIVLITIDFLIIIILVIIENLRMMESPSSSSRMFIQVAPATDYKEQQAKKDFSPTPSRRDRNRCFFWSAMKVNRGSIFFLPIATIIFCLVFFVTGFITYNSK